MAQSVSEGISDVVEAFRGRISCAGIAKATEYVSFELEQQDDEILEWASTRDGFFVPIDGPIQQVVKDILRHHPKLVDDRKGVPAQTPS